jgi:hypothetical protein
MLHIAVGILERAEERMKGETCADSRRTLSWAELLQAEEALYV